MTAEQYWRDLCARYPDLEQGQRVIPIKAENLRKLTEQAWQQGSLHEHMLADEQRAFSRDIFGY